jgi:hypothetical protein
MTKQENFDVNVKYDGYKYRIYYFSIDDLEEELAQVGKFLDSLCEKGEVICEIIPNIGLVHNSIIIGPGFQGVKGFVIIVQKNK